MLLFKETVFNYFIRPKKTTPDGNAEFVDGKQVRFIGQTGNGMLHVNGFVDYSPRLNNTELISRYDKMAHLFVVSKQTRRYN